jgi:DNA-binding MarR family transcriptional regulator
MKPAPPSYADLEAEARAYLEEIGADECLQDLGTRIVQALDAAWRLTKSPPKLDTLADQIGIGSSTLSDRLARLERAGRVIRLRRGVYVPRR